MTSISFRDPHSFPTRRSSDLDMGGTSTDIALLQRGEPSLTGEKTVGIARIALPSLDIHTLGAGGAILAMPTVDRKSTRLNSSHQIISYAAFCLKKKK